MKISSTNFTILNEQPEIHITASGITSEDALNLKKAHAEFGVSASGSVIMFSHKGLIDDNVTLELFNVNLADRSFIRRSQRNLLKVLLIDANTMILKCVKIVTLDAKFVDELANLTLKQVDSHFSAKSFFAQCRMLEKGVFDLELKNSGRTTISTGGIYV